MYNQSWGYYVLGTTHEDRNECTGQAQFGWSEDSQNYVLGHLANSYVNFTTQNWGSFYNRLIGSEPSCTNGYFVGNHCQQSNGVAAWVDVK